jgi:DNA-binding NtrC family response regulator
MVPASDVLRLTIVDDDPTVPPVLASFLSHHFRDELQLTSFDDARAARRSLQEEGCDLLLSDIEMPWCDGLALFEVARTSNAWTQVVYMTARSTWRRLHDARDQGASNYLLKPIVPEELFQVVRGELARFRRWQSAMVDTVVASFSSSS